MVFRLRILTSDMQQILFTGIITKEPKTYQTQLDENGGKDNGVTFCQFYVAVGRLRQNGKRKTDYFSVKAFNRCGDFVQKYGRKGMKVYVQGELQPELIERPTGQIDMLLVVRASSVEFLGRREDINEAILAMGQEGQEEYIDIAEDLIVGW